MEPWPISAAGAHAHCLILCETIVETALARLSNADLLRHVLIPDAIDNDRHRRIHESVHVVGIELKQVKDIVRHLKVGPRTGAISSEPDSST